MNSLPLSPIFNVLRKHAPEFLGRLSAALIERDATRKACEHFRDALPWLEQNFADDGIDRPEWERLRDEILGALK